MKLNNNKASKLSRLISKEKSDLNKVVRVNKVIMLAHKDERKKSGAPTFPFFTAAKRTLPGNRNNKRKPETAVSELKNPVKKFNE
jgi:hypothetical protein